MNCVGFANRSIIADEFRNPATSVDSAVLHGIKHVLLANSLQLLRHCRADALDLPLNGDCTAKIQEQLHSGTAFLCEKLKCGYGLGEDIKAVLQYFNPRRNRVISNVRASEERYSNLVVLANAIEPSASLLDPKWLKRDIVENCVRRNLEVPTLLPNSVTDHYGTGRLVDEPIALLIQVRIVHTTVQLRHCRRTEYLSECASERFAGTPKRREHDPLLMNTGNIGIPDSPAISPL